MAGCAQATPPVATSPVVIPTSTLSPTASLAVTATPAPTLRADELFQEISRNWRVAYYDEHSNQLCAMYGDGRNKLCLGYETYYLPFTNNWVPGSWSPDGSRFAIDASTSGIYIWELGRGVTTFREEADGTIFYDPTRAPSGDYIAYSIGPVQWSAITVTGLFVDSLDRTVHRQIAPIVGSIDWSPDGRRIAYSDGDVWMVSLDGQDAIRLTQHPASDGVPKWAPEGKSIAFLSDRDGLWALFVMNANGSGVRKVANLPIDSNNPYAPFNYTWLPDGKHFLYHDKLIDAETGNIIDLPFPFDPVSATWFMSAEKESILPLPTPHCADSWSRLYAGIYAVVAGDTDDPPNRVRALPDTGDEIISQLYPGDIVLVSGGPVCADGLVFWKVENKSIPGGTGWTAEGGGKEYFLEPYKP
jgi:dipeptidyl aminopeptidase/acylaminoacyl peptidase